MDKKLDKDKVYRIYVFDEMAKKTKHSLEDLGHYVDSLDDDKIKELCRHCSHSRKNGVYRFISRGPNCWTVKVVNISGIYVRRINGNVNGHLSRNGWSLKRISEDKKIPKLREFKKRGNIHSRSLHFIAHKKGDKYKLIDGNHRAIKLACSGKKEFKLVFYVRQ